MKPTPSRWLAIGQGPQVDLLADVDAVVTQDRVGRCYVEVEVRGYMLDQVFLTRKRLSFPARLGDPLLYRVCKVLG